MNIRVAVIIPTYNRAATLGRAIDSLLAQTRMPDEILVVDDGSTDGTACLLRNRYPALGHLRQPHAGVTSSNSRFAAAS